MGAVRALLERRPDVALSPRERDVAGLLVAGLSNKEIAHQLVLSPNTVRSHLANLSARLDVRSRAKLAAKLREIGLVCNPAVKRV